MKKRYLLIVVLAMIMCMAACGKDEPSNSVSSVGNPTLEPTKVVSISEDPIVTPEPTPTPTPTPTPEPDPEGMYRSELTNEWIDESLKNQRPVAVMVDNESTALPHYGTTEADIVYEMMNSTANNRITRLMCILKDWGNIEAIGNVRSTRPTNVMLFPEYNAILIHDGGPFYINQWFEYANATNHLNGGFARIDHGKASFYEEYATGENWTGEGEYSGNSYSSIANRIKKAKYDTEYNKYYMGEHFKFSNDTISLENDKKAFKAENVDLTKAFPHNKTMLAFNAENGTYDYYEYGDLYIDAANEQPMTFENVILYGVDFMEYDDNGYMAYYALGSGDGYFMTEGYAVPIKWAKADMNDLTHFTNAETGEDITLNTGKTYIALVPLDNWKNITIE